MDKTFARRMSALTTEFYERVSTSFSATRQAPWFGWRTLLETVLLSNHGSTLASEFVATSSTRADVGFGATPVLGDRSLRVLDVACGNLRFERFLHDQGFAAETWAIDNCDELVGQVPSGVHFRSLDIAEALLEDELLIWKEEGLQGFARGGASRWSETPLNDVPSCDLSVSFGFMHHLPLFEQRARLLKLLADHAVPGGFVAVTFWQFANDERLKAKAHHAPGGGTDDYLLGWQNEADVWRFCHHTTEDEIDELAATVAHVAPEVMRFTADRCNRYLVLQVGA
ncbi:MAG: class I SAM-dependent methyltransferase [Atopobiaceae bacterium]|nr:class I SAM-dependent methyltransferase [Atopobiaceae bacterium]